MPLHALIGWDGSHDFCAVLTDKTNICQEECTKSPYFYCWMTQIHHSMYIPANSRSESCYTPSSHRDNSPTEDVGTFVFKSWHIIITYPVCKSAHAPATLPVSLTGNCGQEVQELDKRMTERLAVLMVLSAKEHLSNGTQPLAGLLIRPQLWQLFIFTSQVMEITTAFQNFFTVYKRTSLDVPVMVCLQSHCGHGRYILIHNVNTISLWGILLYKCQTKSDTLLDIADYWLTFCYIGSTFAIKWFHSTIQCKHVFSRHSVTTKVDMWPPK